MMPTRRPPPTRDDLIRERREAGDTLEEIAEKFGLSVARVWQIVGAARKPARRRSVRGPLPASTADELQAQLARLAERHGWAGQDRRWKLGVQTVARLTGTSRSTVTRYLSGELPISETFARLVWAMERDPALVGALEAVASALDEDAGEA